MHPTILYHRSCPSGQTFTNEIEYDQAVDDGWVAAPWEIDNKDYHEKKLDTTPIVEEESIHISDPTLERVLAEERLESDTASKSELSAGSPLDGLTHRAKKKPGRPKKGK